MTYWLNETKKGENMSQNGLTTVGVNPSKGLQVLGMSINSLTEAMEVAEFFAKSDLVPKDYKNKPGNIVVAWQKGFEVGLMPQQSLETIAVINGRACIWGDGLIALVKRSPIEEWTNEWMEGEGESMVAFCETKRKDQTKTVKRSFSVEDAKKANLWGKNTWATYPKRMLQMRARGFSLRDAYPEVLNGLQLAEEMLDAQYVAPSRSKEELETALASVGLSLSIEDGKGTVNGKDIFQYSKFLKEIGFSYANGQWSIAVDNHYIEASIEETHKPVDAKPLLPKKSNPKADLMALLLDNGITKDEAGEFVQKTYGDLKDLKKVEQIVSIENRDTLMEQIKAFLTPAPVESNLFEGIPPVGPDEHNMFD